MKKLLTILFCLVVLLPVERADAQDKQEFVKSVLIYKFVSFFSWEQEDFIYQDGKTTVCTIGENYMTLPLTKIGQKQNRNKNNNYVILGDIGLRDIPKCDVLFIGDLSEIAAKRGENAENVLQIIFKTANIHNILTISDVQYFARDGGMVGFVEVDGKIKFNMNIAAIKQANLLVEPMLLELAVKVFR